MMRSLLLFFLQMFLLYPFLSTASSIEICPGCEVKSLKEAVAMDIDTILVSEARYEEELIAIEHPVVIIGLNQPTIYAPRGESLITIRSDSVEIHNLRMENVTQSYVEDKAAIRIKDASHFIIANNVLIDNFFGIYLEHAKDGKVISNLVKSNAVQEMNSGNAIHAWYCKKLLIESNTVEYHRDGIYFEFVEESIIQKNISRYNLRYGLHFMFSNDNKYSHNQFTENGAGVAVMFSKFIIMEHNLFSQNWGTSSYGLLLKEIYDAEIRNNSFIKNTMGIFVEGSTRINYLENEFIRNGWAVRIAGGCLNNDFKKNNFIGNSFDMAAGGSFQYNSIESNYWSDYNGYDLDKDGFGDIPYRPVKLFSYVVEMVPEAIILIRSVFIDLLNFTEKVSPVFTPAKVFDEKPLMTPYASN